MKKSRAFRIFLFLFLFSPLLVPEALSFTGSFEQTVSDKDSVVVATSKVFIKEKHLRAEMKTGPMETIFISNETGTYQYFPSQNSALKMPEGAQNPLLMEAFSDFTQFLQKQKAVLIGSETLEGKACDVYQFKDPTLQVDSKTWVWKEKNFPLKVETIGPKGPITVLFSNVQTETPIDDSLFQLPPQVKIQEFPTRPPQRAAGQAPGFSSASSK